MFFERKELLTRLNGMGAEMETSLCLVHCLATAGLRRDDTATLALNYSLIS